MNRIFESDDGHDLFAKLKLALTKRAERLGKRDAIISYAVIEENEFRYLAIVDEDGMITLLQLYIPNDSEGVLERTVVNQWTVENCKVLVYFQGRKKLIAMALSKIVIIDIVTGQMQYLSDEITTPVVDKSTMCVLADCKQNAQRHNSVPFSKSLNVIAVTTSTKTQLYSFNWNENLLSVNMNTLPIDGKSVMYYGGKLWVAQRGVWTFEIHPDLSYTELDTYCSHKLFCDLVICNEGLAAVAETWIQFFNEKKEMKYVYTSWSCMKAVCWMNSIAIIADVFDGGLFGEGNESENLYVIDSVGKGFSSALQPSKTIFVWRKTIFFIHKEMQSQIHYRSVENMYWTQKKLLWLGHLKNSASECILASIPKDIIKEIQSHLKESVPDAMTRFPRVSSVNMTFHSGRIPIPAARRGLFDESDSDSDSLFGPPPTKPSAPRINSNVPVVHSSLFDSDSDSDSLVGSSSPRTNISAPAVHSSLFDSDDDPLFGLPAPRTSINTPTVRCSIFDSDEDEDSLFGPPPTKPSTAPPLFDIFAPATHKIPLVFSAPKTGPTKSLFDDEED